MANDTGTPRGGGRVAHGHGRGPRRGRGRGRGRGQPQASHSVHGDHDDRGDRGGRGGRGGRGDRGSRGGNNPFGRGVYSGSIGGNYSRTERRNVAGPIPTHSRPGNEIPE
jgi:hypothetical protein